jgi:hypothetical protein
LGLFYYQGIEKRAKRRDRKKNQESRVKKKRLKKLELEKLFLAIFAKILCDLCRKSTRNQEKRIDSYLEQKLKTCKT